MSLASDIAASLGLADRLGVVDATLIKVTAGSRTGGAVSGGTNPSSGSDSCRGYENSFDANQIDGTQVMTNDRMVCLFASTLTAAPEAGDKVTIGGVTYRILSVARDPASVLYMCHGRK